MCHLLLLFMVFAVLNGLPQQALSAEAAWLVTRTSSAAISAVARVDYSIGILSGDMGTAESAPIDYEASADCSSDADYPLLTVWRPANYDVMMIVEIAGRTMDRICLGDINCDGSLISQTKVNGNVLLLRLSEPVNLSANSHDSCVLTIITTDN